VLQTVLNEFLGNHCRLNSGQFETLSLISNYTLSNLTAIFPGGPGLACTRMSPFWILLELRMMEMVVTTEVMCAKFQSNCHHQQTNTQLFTGLMPFLSPNQQCQSTEGKTLKHCI